MPYPEPIRRQVYDTYKCNVIYVVFSTILFPHLRHIKKLHLLCRVPQKSLSALTTQEKATPYMSCSPEIPLRIYDTRKSYAVHVVFPRNLSPHLRHIKKQHLTCRNPRLLFPHLRHKRKLRRTCRNPGQKIRQEEIPPVSCSILRSDYSSVFSSAGASTSTAFAARNSAAFCRRISFLMFSAPASPR